MPEVAGIYCRLSLASMGDTTKVEDQARICRKIADARGWTVPDEFVYIDNNKSAWQRNRLRPSWNKMLIDIEAGKFSNLICYHTDRLVRHPADLEKLLDLADRGGMTIVSPEGQKSLDIGMERTWLRIAAAIAWQSSDDTSRRKKTGFARMARSGFAPVPGGQTGRGFGYEKDGRTPHPLEAPALREAARRMLDGDSLTAIARDLAASGIVSTSGRPLTYATLRRILVRPRIAGLLADGSTGSWEPILDRRTWELVRGVIGDRMSPSSGTAKYLLSGIALCFACGRGVQRQSSARSLGYGCVAEGCRKVHRNMDLLDAYVGRRVVHRLNHPGNPAPRLIKQDDLAAEFGRLAEAQTELAAKITDPDVPHYELLLARYDRIRGRLDELRELTGDAARSRLLEQHRGITWDEWLALPLATRRALVAATFRVEILAVSRMGPQKFKTGPNPLDVRMTPL